MNKPIHLYIKTHNVTGLKYFGKTVSSDPYAYKGSGKRWANHIKVHGYDVTTVILGTFTDIDECRRVALEFSEANDIVKSDEWANLKPESLDGGFEHINCLPREVRSAMSRAWRDSLTEEEKREIDAKKAQPGEKNFWYGKSRSGDLSPTLGMKHSEHSIQLMRDANSNKMVVKDSSTGETVGLVDKDHPDVLSGKWVSINLGRKATDETKRTLSDARKRAGTKPPSPKGLLWWNNGVEVVRARECPGEGYVRSRLLKPL